jgi:hypothetical protein
MSSTRFPIDLSTLEPLKLDPAVSVLTDEQKVTLRHIQIWVTATKKSQAMIP